MLAAIGTTEIVPDSHAISDDGSELTHDITLIEFCSISSAQLLLDLSIDNLFCVETELIV